MALVALFVTAGSATTTADAQTCASQVLRAIPPEIRTYAVANGPAVGMVASDRIPAGTPILGCAPNHRVRLRIDGRELWVDGYSVRTDAKAAPRGIPAPRPVVAGGRGISD